MGIILIVVLIGLCAICLWTLFIIADLKGDFEKLLQENNLIIDKLINIERYVTFIDKDVTKTLKETDNLGLKIRNSYKTNAEILTKNLKQEIILQTKTVFVILENARTGLNMCINIADIVKLYPDEEANGCTALFLRGSTEKYLINDTFQNTVREIIKAKNNQL